jgi:hypothetical protein
MRIELDWEGFTISGGLRWRPQRVAWRNVRGFSVFEVGRFSQMVGFDYEPAACRNSLRIRLGRAVGAEDGLPDVFELTPHHLAHELNEFRRRALSEAR